MQHQAHILSIGLATALGIGVEENCAGLQKQEKKAALRTLDCLSQPVEVPYLAPPVAEASDLRSDFHLVDLAVEEALSASKLSAGQRSTMPLFIGSSSYAVGQSETLYQNALVKGNQYQLALPSAGFDQISAHLRQRFNLTGPSFQLNTACSAAANALLAAAQQIRLGYTDYAFVIGAELFNYTTIAGFNGMQLLTKDCMRPFDRRRNGLILGEGCGALLLGRDNAEEERLIIGAGASGCDTYSITASNPNGSHIASIMRLALQRAEVASNNIVAIKAHGTASPLNDDGEAAGMRKVFKTPPPFFALKPYIGHTLGACGTIETGLIAASLRRGFIPASGGFKEPDDRLAIAPITDALPAQPGWYMLNFFGFGGNNSSLLLSFSA